MAGIPTVGNSQRQEYPLSEIPTDQFGGRSNGNPNPNFKVNPSLVDIPTCKNSRRKPLMAPFS